MKKFVIGIGVVIVLLAVLVILLPFIVDLNRYQSQYVPQIEEALNRKVTLKNIQLMIIPRIGVHVSGFTVLDDPAFSSGPFALLESLDVGVKWIPLLSRKIEIEEVALRDPVITVIKNSEGVLNLSTLGKKELPQPRASLASLRMVSSPPAGEAGPLHILSLLALDRVSFTNGKIFYRDLSATKPAEYTLQQLDLLLKSVGLGQTVSLHLTTVIQPMNLPINLDGSLGPLKESLDIQAINLVVSLGKTALTVKGSVLDGDAKLAIASPSVNASDLPVALPLKKRVEAKELQIAVEAKNQRVLLHNLSLNLFGGQITGQAEVATGSKPPPFDGKVRVEGLQLKPVMEAVGTDKVSVSGTAAARFDMRGVGFSSSDLTDSLAGSGHLEARDGKIEGIDLLKEAFTLLRLVGVKHDITNATAFSIIESDMSVKRGIITVERLRMDSNDFQATATGTIGFDQRLNLNAKISLSQELSRQISGSANVAQIAMTGNRIVVPMRITGMLSAPAYALDTKALGAKLQERVKKQVKEKIQEIFKNLEGR